MPKKVLPDYWKIYFPKNSKGQPKVSLLDGNNHDLLLHGETYKNEQAMLKVIWDRIKPAEVIRVFTRFGGTMICKVMSKRNSKGKSFYFLYPNHLEGHITQRINIKTGKFMPKPPKSAMI